MQLFFETRQTFTVICVILLALVALPQKAWPAASEAGEEDAEIVAPNPTGQPLPDSLPRSTNLPLPRFVSFRTDPINMRTGPGVRYPIDWVYSRRGLPVEVVAEFDTWRRINDPEGSNGWVHTSMLSSRRTAIVIGGLRPLRRTSENEGQILAQLEPGVIVSLQRCPIGSYCRIEIDGVQGWMRRDHLWGVFADEVIE